MVMMEALRWTLGAATDLAFVPALLEVYKRRRHFELFIGSLQLVSSFLFNSSQALGEKLFIGELDWHFISDVLSLTYVCCLLIHCMGIEDEVKNMILRYVAFSLAWIFKLRDAWDSALWEAALVIIYVCLAVYSVAQQSSRISAQYGMQSLRYGAGCLVGACLLLGVELAGFADSYGFVLAAVHLLGAATAFFLWRGVPSFDTKKNDDLLPRSGASSQQFV
ncbi:Hypothetical Protein FCC1311_107432 [Hondaea fermentalgiana]|uniref:Uncharacterized protein n=1 Tax=Hondaea fermentalgiana TaxID=2315210 RepID=A0A2R5GW13_9STRA|nr:Hypothetical Protein FCC1311_107432 [Hondaea fermentalgiana]|eukprot:GBG34519.1 Hypothetical Protein FCC1311_107432 [Hondaea fermentalgiana]